MTRRSKAVLGPSDLPIGATHPDGRAADGNSLVPGSGSATVSTRSDPASRGLTVKARISAAPVLVDQSTQSRTSRQADMCATTKHRRAHAYNTMPWQCSRCCQRSISNVSPKTDLTPEVFCCSHGIMSYAEVALHAGHVEEARAVITEFDDLSAR